MLAWASFRTSPASDTPIQDNSFLVEEAYNQEPGVVQHITTFERAHSGGGWIASFTQEWPAPSLRHQLSFTVPYERLSDLDGGRSGLGDVLLNWRIQAVGSGEDEVAFSPRLSLVLPTGKEEAGLGSGAVGIQTNLPLSVAWGERFVTHTNLGATYVPDAKSPSGAEADTLSIFGGQSAIWLASPRVNVMLEAFWERAESVVGPGLISKEDAFVVAPGVRFAIDLPSGLQIVPGVAVPIGLGRRSGEESVFLYLSFEHPF